MFDDAIKSFIQRKVASNKLGDGRSLLAEGKQKIISDPFLAMPKELVWQIARYLPADSLLALCSASWAVLSATRDNTFWEAFIYHDMPWAAMEFKDIINNVQSCDLDCKALHLWIKRMTAPKYGLPAPWMGLANRRRIWDVCQAFSDLCSW